MVHNGIEYGLMQAYAEGYELLTASELEIDADAALRSWQHGSVVRSWLLDLLVLGLEQDPGLAGIRGYASDSGEGRWTGQRGGAPRRAPPGDLRRPLRPLRLPPGGLAGDEGGGLAPQPVRRPLHPRRPYRRPAESITGASRRRGRQGEPS
jgi:hypothetical protein